MSMRTHKSTVSTKASYGFVNDEGTGLASTGAGSLSLLSAGTEMATMSSGGVLNLPTDKLTVNSIPVHPYVVINHKLNPANTSGEFVFIADRAYTVVSIKEIHNVVAGQTCACSVRKLTTAGKLASDAIGTGVIDLLASDLAMTSTAATTVTATLTATTADRDLASGDRIGIKMGNATSLVGGVVTIVLKAK